MPELQRTEAAVLRGELISLPPLLCGGTMAQVGEMAARFLDVAGNSIAGKGGVFQQSMGYIVVGTFMPSGKVGECELRAVEAARRVLYDVRRFNAESPKYPMQVKLALEAGPYFRGTAQVAGKAEELMLGEALFTVAKMNDTAPVDSVVVSETVHFRVGHLFKGRAISEVQCNGRTVKIFELIL